MHDYLEIIKEKNNIKINLNIGDILNFISSKKPIRKNKLPNIIIDKKKILILMKKIMQNKDNIYIINPPTLSVGIIWKAWGLLSSSSENPKKRLWFFIIIKVNTIVRSDNKKILYKNIIF